MITVELEFVPSAAGNRQTYNVSLERSRKNGRIQTVSVDMAVSRTVRVFLRLFQKAQQWHRCISQQSLFVHLHFNYFGLLKLDHFNFFKCLIRFI